MTVGHLSNFLRISFITNSTIFSLRKREVAIKFVLELRKLDTIMVGLKFKVSSFRFNWNLKHAIPKKKNVSGAKSCDEKHGKIIAVHC